MLGRMSVLRAVETCGVLFLQGEAAPVGWRMATEWQKHLGQAEGLAHCISSALPLHFHLPWIPVSVG